ncbi:MAG TPA: hypothetical protein VJ397_11055 [Thermoplasmata archaeon]|nr:hypothetical protein [Thermoplasmata archaeon]
MVRAAVLPATLRGRVALLLLVTAAIAVREAPGWQNAAWGNDFGIYLGITERMLDTGELFPAYDGWGTSYQFFPTFYLLSASAHVLTGADLVWLMPKVAGILGGLGVLFFYLFVAESSRDRRLALLATAFLAFDPIHAYQTAHAAPLTAGHLFLAASLYGFLRWRRTGKPVLLGLAAAALIPSHHLTTYFFILSVGGMALGGHLLGRTGRGQLRRELLFLAVFTAAAFAYWGTVATPVADQVRNATGLPLVAVLALTLALLAAAPRMAGRMAPRLGRLVQRLSRVPPSRAFAITFLAGCLALLSAVVLPRGLGPALPAVALLVLLPPVLVGAFAAAGLLGHLRAGTGSPQLGMLAALLASLAFALVANSTALLSYRHLEYLALPTAALAATGVLQSLKRSPRWAATPRRWNRPSPRWAAPVGALLALFVANAASGVAVMGGALGIDERIPDVSLEAVDWLAGNATRSSSVAADHRLSQILWARGLNATGDRADLLWASTDWWDGVGELAGSAARVDYVVLDHVMVDHGAQSGADDVPAPMSREAHAKFGRAPFVRVFRSESEDGTRWAEVYRVDWPWILAHATRSPGGF